MGYNDINSINSLDNLLQSTGKAELSAVQTADKQMPVQPSAGRKRNQERALAAPIVYEPSAKPLRSPSVKPIQFSDDGKRAGARSKLRFVLISILLGVLSGMMLIFFDQQHNLLYTLHSFSENETYLFCLLWGGVMGLIYGLILSFFYRRLPSTMPSYAALLFLPVILLLLMPLLVSATDVVAAILGALFSLVCGAIGLFILWSIFFG